MNKLNNKKSLLCLILAIILGTAIIRPHSLSNVSACTQSPVCNYSSNEPIGTLTTTQYGYPVTYREDIGFVPNDNHENRPHYAGFASADIETQSISQVDIFINVIFWFALLMLVAALVPLNRPSKTTPKSKKSRPKRVS